jgi:hypothetical protein
MRLLDPLPGGCGSLHLQQDITWCLEPVIQLHVDLDSHDQRSIRKKIPAGATGYPARTAPAGALFLKW